MITILKKNNTCSLEIDNSRICVSYYGGEFIIREWLDNNTVGRYHLYEQVEDFYAFGVFI